MLTIIDGGNRPSVEDSTFCFRRFFLFLLPIAVGSPPAFEDVANILIGGEELLFTVGWKSGAVEEEDSDEDRVKRRLQVGLVAVRSGEMGASMINSEPIVVFTAGCRGEDVAISFMIPARTAPRSSIAIRIFLAKEEDFTDPIAATECSPDMVQSHEMQYTMQANASFISEVILPAVDLTGR